MRQKTTVGGAVYNITGGRCNVGGATYRIVEGRTLANGTVFNIPIDNPFRHLSDIPVGDSVWVDVGGRRTEFIVVHQGRPDGTAYSANCNGTWILSKYLDTRIAWGITALIGYENSMIRSHLEGSYYNSIAPHARAAIAEVGLPYPARDNRDGSPGVVQLLSRVFVPSLIEVGGDERTLPNYSANSPPFTGRISYFSGEELTQKRQAKFDLNGSNSTWWLRDSLIDSNMAMVYSDGRAVVNNGESIVPYGVRPMMVMTPDARVDDLGNVFNKRV